MNETDRTTESSERGEGTIFGPLPTLGWVVLTQGDRPDDLVAAVDSITQVCSGPVVVVANGSDANAVRERLGPPTRVCASDTNLGVPGGRDFGLGCFGDEPPDVIGFLDDDAVIVSADLAERVRASFAADDRLAAISFRIVDETGASSQRHVPRLRRRGAARSGDVAYFLGGACAIRTSSYRRAGGYWTELFYGHEELDLAWRLLDDGWRCRYDADSVVRHPRTEISRHPEAWFRTGRNRVRIARRNLPWLVRWAHLATWLIIGTWRSGSRASALEYLRGYRAGLADPVTRRPIAWATVWRLTRLGRPPIL